MPVPCAGLTCTRKRVRPSGGTPTSTRWYEGLRKSKEITATQFQGTFSIKANPLLSLATHAMEQRPGSFVLLYPLRVLRAKGGGLP